MIKSFRDMKVWQRSVSLSTKIYEETSPLPRSEDYGLTSQLRRSANSVSANIAEGFGRRGSKDKGRFYIIARGSAFETQSHIIYGNKVEYFDDSLVAKLLDEYDDLIFQLNKITKSLN